MKLSAVAIKQAKPRDKEYKLSDGRGLYLLVKPSGAKYWRMKYRYLGKEKKLSFGVFPEVSLAQARKKVAEAHNLLDEGLDPGLVKKQRKQAALENAQNTFRALAREWWDFMEGRWTERHAKRVWQTLEVDVFPALGDRPYADITPPDVLSAIKKVEARGALDVAGRLMQRCSAIFRYGVQTGRLQVNPAAEMRGVLKTRKVQHRNALPAAQLPEFLKKLANYEGQVMTRLALELLILTFVRPGELRGAKWIEFDFEKSLWRIPAERMKMKTEHLVPLSTEAVAVLKCLKQLSGNYELVFPGNINRNQPISNNTMTYALYRMGFKGRATPHGFRATASSILNEEGFNRDAIERQLSHEERNKVRGAYTHQAEYLDERTRIMQWWADYLVKRGLGGRLKIKKPLSILEMAHNYHAH